MAAFLKRKVIGQRAMAAINNPIVATRMRRLCAWGLRRARMAKKNEHRKNQHIRERNNVEKLRVPSSRASRPDQRVGGRQDAENHHQTSQKEACHAEPAMKVNPARGDKGGLSDKQENPAGECRPM